jgi:hypothetical protein
VNEIGCIGVRLLYFYESYINRNNNKVKFCYVSYETVRDCIGLSTKTIAEYNDVLIKTKLLKVTKHRLGTEYEYDKDDALVFDRWNNHYEVRLDKI